MEAEKEVPERAGREEKAGGKPSSKQRKCKRKECEATFDSKQALNEHLVAKHSYLRCPHCSKVFKQQIRLDKHSPKHRQSLPESSAQPQTVLRAQTEDVRELTKATVQYFRDVEKLLEDRESKGWAFAQMTSKLLSGMATQPHTGKALALYMHALEIALSLPAQSPFSSLLSTTSVDPASSTVIEHSQGSRDTSHTGTTPESEKQDNRDLNDTSNEAVSERVSISIPISALTVEPEKPVVRGKGLLFSLHEKELRRKRRLKERKERKEEKAEGYKKRKVHSHVYLSVPEVPASLLPAPVPVECEQGAVSLICIEEPCSLRFCSASELLAHLEAVHYNYKSCN